MNMFNWLTQVILVVSAMTPVAASTGSRLSSLPNQPTQDQISCHNAIWEKANLIEHQSHKVNKKLDPYVIKMQEDSQKVGFNIQLTSAYRDCTEQGGLRALACGTGTYNLKIKPIIECAPPTEPAGRSLHNEGLAVDLSCYGYTNFAYSPCYSWLKPRSALYQIKEHNLEPWHWSTTGH